MSYSSFFGLSHHCWALRVVVGSSCVLCIIVRWCTASSPRLPHLTKSGRSLPCLVIPAIFVVIGFVVFMVVASIVFIVIVSALLALLLLFILSLLILLVLVLLPPSLHASSVPFPSSSPWLPPSWSLICRHWVPLVVIGKAGHRSRSLWVTCGFTCRNTCRDPDLQVQVTCGYRSLRIWV